MDKGYNRNLAISVFKDGKLTDRMVQAQKANDEEWYVEKAICMMRIIY